MSGDLRSAALEALMQRDLPMGLALLDTELRYVAINPMLARANGLTVAQHLGRAVAEVLPKAAGLLLPLLQEVLQTGRASHFQIQAEVPSLPGELSEWEASYLPVHDEQGQVCGVLVQALNHSLERQAEQLRQDSEQRLRCVLDSLYVFVGVLDPEGRLLEANRAPLEAGGIALEQVRGRLFWETPWWTHDPPLCDWLRQAVTRVAAGEAVRRDVIVRMADDARLEIDFSMVPLRDEHGRISHLIASATDISARRASEKALQHSEDRFRRVFEGATVGMGLIDRQGQILLANESMAQMFGYRRDELLGLAVHQLVPQRQRDAHHAHVQQFMRTPALRYMAKRQELYALRRDGSEFTVEIGLNPLPGSDGQQVLATISDVSERRAAQAQIERALAEKTVLLNEVHHRVKNNLQVISSLLNLQARNADPMVRDALRDSQSRVHSMALMHQLLYERADLSTLELGHYLQRLVNLLRDTYLDASQRVQLLVEAPQQGLSMDLQRAIPFGLVVTELVTNALKHAFPEGRHGTIWVRLQGGPQPWLEVADDGVGLPAPVLPGEGRSLGYQLLPLLADQCGATLELQRSPGTRARLSWSTEVIHA